MAAASVLQLRSSFAASWHSCAFCEAFTAASSVATVLQWGLWDLAIRGPNRRWGRNEDQNLHGDLPCVCIVLYSHFMVGWFLTRSTGACNMSRHKKQLDVFKITQNLQVSHLQIHGKDVTIFPENTPQRRSLSNGNSSGNHKRKTSSKLSNSRAQLRQLLSLRCLKETKDLLPLTALLARTHGRMAADRRHCRGCGAFQHSGEKDQSPLPLTCKNGGDTGMGSGFWLGTYGESMGKWWSTGRFEVFSPWNSHDLDRFRLPSHTHWWKRCSWCYQVLLLPKALRQKHSVLAAIDLPSRRHWLLHCSW